MWRVKSKTLRSLTHTLTYTYTVEFILHAVVAGNVDVIHVSSVVSISTGLVVLMSRRSAEREHTTDQNRYMKREVVLCAGQRLRTTLLPLQIEKVVGHGLFPICLSRSEQNSRFYPGARICVNDPFTLVSDDFPTLYRGTKRMWPRKKDFDPFFVKNR